MRYFIVSFLLAELYFVSGFSYFWLIVAWLFAFYFLTQQFEGIEEWEGKSLYLAYPMALLFGVFLYFPKNFTWTTVTNQVFLIIGYVVFYFLAKLYRRYCYRPDFFRIFGPIAVAPMAFLFFRSNLFKNFFWKELVVFLLLLFFFEVYRQIFAKKKYSIALSLIPAFVLLEFAWVLNFLPINFLSIMGVWLIIFVLTNEFWLLNCDRQFKLKFFLPELIFGLILIAVILISGSWRML